MPWLQFNSTLYAIFISIIAYDFQKYYTTTTTSIYELGLNAFFGAASALYFFIRSKSSGRLSKVAGLVDTTMMLALTFTLQVMSFFAYSEFKGSYYPS